MTFLCLFGLLALTSMTATSPVNSSSTPEIAAPIKMESPIEPAVPIKTAAPIKMASPIETVAPIKIAAPIKTAAPIKSAAPIKTAVPIKQAASIKTAAPIETAGPNKTPLPIAQTLPVDTAPPVKTESPVTTASPAATAPPAETAPPVDTSSPSPPPVTNLPSSIAVSDVVAAASNIQRIFDEIRVRIESGLVPKTLADFLTRLEAAVDAECDEATPTVARILGRMKAAVGELIAEGPTPQVAGEKRRKPFLQILLAKIWEKIDELRGEFEIADASYRLDTLHPLKDILHPTLVDSVRRLVPVMTTVFGPDTADRSASKGYVEYIAIIDILEIAQYVLDYYIDYPNAPLDNFVAYLNSTSTSIGKEREESTPVVQDALDKVRDVVDNLVFKACLPREAGA